MSNRIEKSVLEAKEIYSFINLETHREDHFFSLLDTGNISELIRSKRKGLMSFNKFYSNETEQLCLELFCLYTATNNSYNKKQLNFYIAMLETEMSLNRSILSTNQLTKLEQLCTNSSKDTQANSNVEFIKDFNLIDLKDKDVNAEFAYYLKMLLDLKDDMYKSKIAISSLTANMELGLNDWNIMLDKIQAIKNSLDTLEKLLKNLNKINKYKAPETDVYNELDIFDIVFEANEYYFPTFRNLVSYKNKILN